VCASTRLCRLQSYELLADTKRSAFEQEECLNRSPGASQRETNELAELKMAVIRSQRKLAAKQFDLSMQMKHAAMVGKF
jgi:hypothetical protein